MNRIATFLLVVGISSCLGYSLAASSCQWTVKYSKEMPPCFADTFTFPTKDGVHYVVRPSHPLKLGQTITIRFSIEGTGRLVPTEGAPPAKLRLLLQQKEDTLTAAEQDKRWWSAPVDLIAGEHTLTAKIDPALWYQVFGQNGATRPERFKEAIEHLGNVGFTFGGVFAGHGVFSETAPMTFVLKEFSVN